MTVDIDDVLSGVRVLIVEDRYLIAAEVADTVRGLGGKVLGPSRDIESATEILRREAIDIALLDVNLDHTSVFPLALALEERGVPFAFLTGYDSDVLPVQWRERPRLSKPLDPRALRDALLRLSRSVPG